MAYFYRSVAVAIVQRPDLPAFTVPISGAKLDFSAKENMAAASKALVKRYPSAYIEKWKATGDPVAFQVEIGGLPMPTKPGGPAPQPKIGDPGLTVLATLRFSWDEVKG